MRLRRDGARKCQTSVARRPARHPQGRDRATQRLRVANSGPGAGAAVHSRARGRGMGLGSASWLLEVLGRLVVAREVLSTPQSRTGRVHRSAELMNVPEAFNGKVFDHGMRPLLAPWRGLGNRPRPSPRVLKALGLFSVLDASR